MKRFLISTSAIFCAAMASAETYVFTPNPADIYDLDHYKYYTWGISWTLPANERIVEAELRFKNIYNWEEEPNVLYTHLLNNAPVGVREYDDNQGGGDAFAGQGPLIGQWSDPAGGQATGFNLVYKLSDLGLIDEMNEYVQDGNFGFGFDPDCHYFNDGVKLKITTEAVPEPASMLALGAGVAVVVRRRRSKRANA